MAHLPTKFIESTPCQQVAPGSAKFLFMPDITNKATGVALIVLIVLYVGSQLASTLIATATADPNQRRLMLLLPVVFVVILYRYPAGSARVLDHDEPVDDRPAVPDQTTYGPAREVGQPAAAGNGDRQGQQTNAAAGACARGGGGGGGCVVVQSRRVEPSSGSAAAAAAQEEEKVG